MEYLFTWENWIYAGIILLILEIFTPGFVVACIGIGALVTSPFAYFGAPVSVQLLVFSLATLFSFLGIRPYVLKYIYNSDKETITNADTLIGKVVKVKETINNNQNKGRIIIYGDNWRARSEDGSIIEEGETIEVVKIESTVMIVKLKQN